MSPAKHKKRMPNHKSGKVIKIPNSRVGKMI